MVAPLLSLVGLIVIAIVTLSLFNGHLPTAAAPANGGQGPVAGRTPTPSNVIDVNPHADVPGSIVYVKAGNLWIQSGKSTRMITNAGTDTMPSWSPDGKWIYFIETRPSVGTYALPGELPSRFTENYPVVTRIHPDGTGRQTVKSGLFKNTRGTWFSWIRQPVLSPDGRTLAFCSDGPDPSNSDVVLQLYDLQTRKSTIPRLPENPPLGHQDPAWSPDGRQLLYVKNGREGARGAPSIMRYDVRTKRVTALTGPGYTSPAWSPDGSYVVVTKTGTLGTDIVILDSRNGNELLRVTDDGRSWSPVWSPKGDAISYLHINGQVVDLLYVGLRGTAPRWTRGDIIPLTDLGGLDPGSRPSWYLAGAQQPAPSPSPAASPSPSQ